MAIYPKGQWRPLPENATEPKIKATQVILHTAVDAPGSSDLFRYFERRDIRIESHFWIRKSGAIEQFIDTDRQADANYRANNKAISIETEDDGDPEGNPWTKDQLDSIIELCKWLSAIHNIPKKLCQSPEDPGFGWHAMWSFGDPIRQINPKTSPWTPSFGKTCPGKTRIHQILDVVMPAIIKPEVRYNEDTINEIVKRLLRDS